MKIFPLTDQYYILCYGFKRICWAHFFSVKCTVGKGKKFASSRYRQSSASSDLITITRASRCTNSFMITKTVEWYYGRRKILLFRYLLVIFMTKMLRIFFESKILHFWPDVLFLSLCSMAALRHFNCRQNCNDTDTDRFRVSIFIRIGPCGSLFILVFWRIDGLLA
jgi:hypothetical protein